MNKLSAASGNCRRTNERTNRRTNGRRDERTDGRKKRQTNGRTDERRHYEFHGTIQSRNPVSGNVRLQNEQPKASLNSVQDERIDGRTNELTEGRTGGLNKGRTGARTNEGTTEGTDGHMHMRTAQTNMGRHLTHIH